MTSLTVTRLGAQAKRVLGSHTRFQVAALFTRSMYIEDEQGGLVCILDDTMEDGPLHVLVDGWPEGGGGIVVGDVFMREGKVLTSSGMAIDFSAAPVWTPPVVSAWTRQTLQAGVNRLATVTTDFVRGGTVLYALHRNEEPGDPLAAALVRRVRTGLQELDEYFWHGGGEVPVSLLGLGPGLTPTGDDILAGMFLTDRVCGFDDAAVAGYATALRERLSSGTNAISASHLMAAMDGEACAAFHDILGAVLAGGAGLEAVLPRLNGVGHSSGWDGLLGILWMLQRDTGPIRR